MVMKLCENYYFLTQYLVRIFLKFYVRVRSVMVILFVVFRLLEHTKIATHKSHQFPSHVYFVVKCEIS